MAALACDICGGKLIMGSGSIAVCDSCGMEHSKSRMQEKVQEIKGTVRVDNSHLVENWMKMGSAAAEAGNHKEAYEYFTKVIEVDSTNWRAIYEKGKAAAWQSTLGNLRLAELYQSIVEALRLAETSGMDITEVAVVRNEFAVALFNVNNAITDLMQENISKLDDLYMDAHWDQMWETRQRSITNVEKIEDAITLIADLDDDLSKSNIVEMKKRICNDLCYVCGNYYLYWHDYSQDSQNYFGFYAKDKKQYLEKYEQLLGEIREVELDYATSEYMLIDPFDVPQNTQQSFERREKIKEADTKRNVERQKRIKEEKRKKYFDEHPDEIAELKAREEKVKGINVDLRAQEQTIKALNKQKQTFVLGIDNLKKAIVSKQDEIDRKERKIFGKSKAMEVITQCKAQIRSLELEIEIQFQHLLLSGLQRS